MRKERGGTLEIFLNLWAGRTSQPLFFFFFLYSSRPDCRNYVTSFKSGTFREAQCILQCEVLDSSFSFSCWLCFVVTKVMQTHVCVRAQNKTDQKVFWSNYIAVYLREMEQLAGISVNLTLIVIHMLLPIFDDTMITCSFCLCVTF